MVRSKASGSGGGKGGRAGRGQRTRGASHRGAQLNQWSEYDMQSALLTYYESVVVSVCALFHFVVSLCYHKSNDSIVYFRACRLLGPEHVSIGGIARQFSVPKTTLWKRITGRVRGTGHRSGGRGVSRILTPGKYCFGTS